MIEGGKATASAPLGPALGPLGINIGEVVKEINEKTKGFAGMKVPVKVNVDSGTKTFEIEVGFPPMSAIIKKEAGIDKATKDPKREFVADLSIDQAVKIAKQKADSLQSYNIKSNVKEVLGTCDSMGVKVEGKRAKETIKLLDSGRFDSRLEGAGKKEEPAAGEKPTEEKKEEPAAGEKPAAEEKPAPEEKPAAEEKKEEPAAEEKPAPAAEKQQE